MGWLEPGGRSQVKAKSIGAQDVELIASTCCPRFLLFEPANGDYPDSKVLNITSFIVFLRACDV